MVKLDPYYIFPAESVGYIAMASSATGTHPFSIMVCFRGSERSVQVNYANKCERDRAVYQLRVDIERELGTSPKKIIELEHQIALLRADVRSVKKILKGGETK